MSKLKHEYVEYFNDVPIQKYAAAFIGKDEDTIIRWKKQDKHFADAIEKAKATWIRKKVLATKAEFALERLEASIFGKNSTGLTVNLPAPIVYLPQDLPENTLLTELSE